MSTLTKQEEAMVRSLVKSDTWDLLLRLLAEYKSTIELERPNGANAFETLRDLHTRHGKIDGLVDFFNKIESNTLS